MVKWFTHFYSPQGASLRYVTHDPFSVKLHACRKWQISAVPAESIITMTNEKSISVFLFPTMVRVRLASNHSLITLFFTLFLSQAVYSQSLPKCIQPCISSSATDAKCSECALCALFSITRMIYAPVIGTISPACARFLCLAGLSSTVLDYTVHWRPRRRPKE